ncbi:MAG: hypothetical protein ACLFPG_02845, partial [Desulfohalobiaceae bacterium]
MLQSAGNKARENQGQADAQGEYEEQAACLGVANRELLFDMYQKRTWNQPGAKIEKEKTADQNDLKKSKSNTELRAVFWKFHARFLQGCRSFVYEL